MAGGFGTNMGGLAAMPAGYLATQTQMMDQAAGAALGQALIQMSGGAPTGWGPTAPIINQLLPQQGQGQQPQPSAPPGPQAPQAGPQPGPPGNPMPQAQPIMVPPGGGAPPPPMGGAGPAQANPAQMAASGPAPMRPPGPAPTLGGPPAAQTAGTPGGGLPPGVPQNMDWRQLVKSIVQANPGAPPEVIAAAVTKAMPLMNASSQEQWKQISLMLQEQRLNQTATNQERMSADRERNLDLRERSIGDTEQRNADLAKHRAFLEDAKSTQLKQAADAARQKATQFNTMMDYKARQAALDEYYKQQRAYDAYQRARISAASNLAGKDKKEMTSQLDEEWNDFKQEHEILKQQLKEDQAGSKSPGQGSSSPPPGNPTTPAGRVNEGFSGTGQGHQMPPDLASKMQRDIQANPQFKDAIIQDYQQKGWIVPPGL